MEQATEVEKMYMKLARSKKMTPRKRMFLDIMCFAFIGLNTKNNHIDVKEEKTKVVENGEFKKTIVYTIIVNDL